MGKNIYNIYFCFVFSLVDKQCNGDTALFPKDRQCNCGLGYYFNIDIPLNFPPHLSIYSQINLIWILNLLFPSVLCTNSKSIYSERA